MKIFTVKNFVMIACITLLSSCGVNMVSSIEEIPEKYRPEAELVHSVKTGMTRTQVHQILGEPDTYVKGIKDRWQVYQDDKMGGVEIIYLKGSVAKITFARHVKPKFGFVKRGSFSSIK